MKLKAVRYDRGDDMQKIKLWLWCQGVGSNGYVNRE